jgi:hypothetical protein
MNKARNWQLIFRILAIVAVALVAIWAFKNIQSKPVSGMSIEFYHPQKFDTILGYSIGKTMAERGKPNNPNNKPKVGDTCPQCDGTGREPGDGTVDIACGQCKGDGRVDEGDPIVSISTPVQLEEAVTIDVDPFDIADIAEFPVYIPPAPVIESEKRVSVNIEGVVFRYNNSNGLFYSPDRTKVLDIDPISIDDIDSIKSIETCSKETGLCSQYDLRIE